MIATHPATHTQSHHQSAPHRDHTPVIHPHHMQALSVGTAGIPFGVDPNMPPSGTGCVECLASGTGWWLHLRRCAECGHVGCCDQSPMRHGTAHFHETGHPIMQSFEPGEDWFYDYDNGAQGTLALELMAPTSHPESQAVPYRIL